jgi:hypothetical protein
VTDAFLYTIFLLLTEKIEIICSVKTEQESFIKKVTNMPITVIRKIPGRDIPSQWTEGIKESLEQTFTVIIRPEGKFSTSRKDRRNRILKMLEGSAGNESSEEWIELIRSARTVSPLKVIFE